MSNDLESECEELIEHYREMAELAGGEAFSVAYNGAADELESLLENHEQ